MGIDAIVFAEKSKTYLYIDREYNLSIAINSDKQICDGGETLCHLKDIFDRARYKGVLGGELAFLIYANIRECLRLMQVRDTEIHDSCLLYNSKVAIMISDLPMDETYRIYNDCSQFDDYIDVKKKYPEHRVAKW